MDWWTKRRSLDPFSTAIFDVMERPRSMLVPVRTYVIAAVNSESFRRRPLRFFFSVLKLIRQKNTAVEHNTPACQ